MAADTAAKRWSARTIASPWRGPAYPQASQDAGQRAAGIYLYSGIAGAAPGGAIKRNYLTLLGVSLMGLLPWK